MKKYEANAENAERITQTNESQVFQGNRNSSEFLPNILKTEVNVKSLENTLDRMLSSGTTETVDLLWGQDRTKQNSGKDFYRKDSRLRDLNQLSVAIQNQSGLVSYQDVLGYWGFSDTDLTVNSKFANPGYVLDLPINLDMFVNFVNYYWIPTFVPVCEVEGDASNPITISDIVSLSHYQSPDVNGTTGLKFYNGMRVKFVGNHIVEDNGYEKDVVYLVEGVGSRNIKLITQINSAGKYVLGHVLSYTPRVASESETGLYNYSINVLPDYVVQDRSSLEQNAWARGNHWVSKYAIEEIARYNDISVTDITTSEHTVKGQHPIIEFKPNLKLWSHGVDSLGGIDFIIFDVDPDQDIVGQSSYEFLFEGSVVLFINAGSYSDGIYTVAGPGTGDPISLTKFLDDQDFVEGNTVHVMNPASLKSGRDYRWTGSEWRETQTKNERGQPLRLELYSEFGYSLGDPNEFPDNDFNGNTVWDYHRLDDTSAYVSALNFSPSRYSDHQGDYRFDFSLDTTRYRYADGTVPGLYFYKDFSNDQLYNGWSELSYGQSANAVQRHHVESQDDLEFTLYGYQKPVKKVHFTRGDKGVNVYFLAESGWVPQEFGYPTLNFNIDETYDIELAFPNQIEFTDPYGNADSSIQVTDTTLFIDPAYEFSSVRYHDTSNYGNQYGIIMVGENAYNEISVYKNNSKLVYDRDYEFDKVTKTLTVTKSALTDDVLEVYYTSDLVDTRESVYQSPVHFYNPTNEPFVGGSYSELIPHFRKQIESLPTNVGNGYGSNDYHQNSRVHSYDGTIRQQINSPAKTELLINESAGILDTLESARRDYEQFHRRFQSKVQQLWVSQANWDSIRELVDTAIQEISVGKMRSSRYALSNMAFASNVVVSDTVSSGGTNEFDVSASSVTIDGISTHLYVWVNDYESGLSTPVWRILTKGIDYTVSDGNITVDDSKISFNGNSDVGLVISRNTIDEFSWIPFSLSKVGIFQPSVPTVDSDTLVCHDGARVQLKENATIYDMSSVDFDVVGAALYDLETRIFNNLQIDYPTSGIQLEPKQNNIWSDESWTAYINLLNQYYIRWSIDNGFELQYYYDFDSNDEFTFNYEWYLEGATSWKLLYRYLFGTDRPDLYPWKMLGYVQKPANWDSNYSWTDTAKRNNLIEALVSGSDSEFSNFEPTRSYASIDWTNNSPVDSSGNLVGPITSGIISSYNLEDVAQQPKSLTLLGDNEIAWEDSRSYQFARASALYELNPYRFTEVFWQNDTYNTLELANSAFNQWVFDSTRTRINPGFESNDWYGFEFTDGIITKVDITNNTNPYFGNLTFKLGDSDHNAVILLADIQLFIDSSNMITGLAINDSGEGYFEDFEIELENGTILSAEVSFDIRHRKLGLVSLVSENKPLNQNIFTGVDTHTEVSIGGFSSDDLLDLRTLSGYAGDMIDISNQDRRLFLHHSRPDEYYRYSSIKIVFNRGLFEISGYDNQNTSFNWFKPIENSNFDLLVAETSEAREYKTFSKNVSSIVYGETIRKRQELVDFVNGWAKYINDTHGVDISDISRDLRDLFVWALHASDGDEYVFVPGDTELTLSNPDIGYIKNLAESEIIFASGSNRNSENGFDVLRSSESIKLEFNDAVPGLIVFERLYLEHKLLADNRVEGQIIYDPVLGLQQPRMLLQGQKTRDWNGRLNVPGFSVRGNSIIPTFESTVREMERDINRVDSKLINSTKKKSSWFNVGYIDHEFLDAQALTDQTQFLYSQGKNMYTGTKLGLDAYLRQNHLFGNQQLVDNELIELWMAHTGEYGDYRKFETIEVEILPDLVNSSPQLVRFNKEYKYDSAEDLVIDVYENDSLVVNGDFSNPIPMLPLNLTDNTTFDQADLRSQSFSTAGQPLENEARYKIFSVDNLPDVYDENELYATIKNWSKSQSYKRGDIVRRGAKVYELDIPSTGLTSAVQPITIRGSATFPVVESGNTLEIDGTTIDLIRTETETIYDPIEITGTVSDPQVFNLQTLVLDGETIEFTKTTEVTVYNDIVVNGTTTNPTITGTSGKNLIIDSVTINFEETVTNTVSVTVGEFYLDAWQQLGDSTLARDSYITAFNDLRSSYITANNQASWDIWVSSYFSQGILENDEIGFNIDFLQTEYSNATGLGYETDLENFLTENVDIVNEITGNSYSITDSIPTADIEAVYTAMTNGDYSGLITDATYANYVTSGTAISTSDTLGSTTVTEPKEWTLTEIVNEINTAAITNVTAATDGGNRLEITKDPASGSDDLVIGNGTANAEVGFPTQETTYSPTSQTQTVGDYLTLEETVQQIINKNITDVTAYLTSSDQIVIRSTNATLEFGGGSAAPVIGLPTSGVINAASDQEVNTVPLNVEQIADSINAESLSNVTATAVDGNLVITSTNPQLTIGVGSANTIVGINPQTVNADEVVSNDFELSDWNEVNEPALFRIWLLDNKGESNSIISPAGWNVYQVQDPGLEITEVCAGTENDDEALIKTTSAHNLLVGDYVLLVGTSNTPNTDGIHRVTKVAGDSTSRNFYINFFIEEKGFTGKVLPLRSVRFSSEVAMDSTLTSNRYTWTDGSIVYVDSDSDGLESAYKYVQTGTDDPDYFEMIRQRGPRVDNNTLGKVTLYDGDENRVIQHFQIFDPIKGLIPGRAQAEIDYFDVQDPAVYSATSDDSVTVNFTQPWGHEKHKTVWWDTSTAVYYDYEQSTIEYRRATWGKLFPTSSIDVYEWTASPVPPDEYDSEVENGTVFDGEVLTGTPRRQVSLGGDVSYSWTEIQQYSLARDEETTVYYFWVKNKTSVPASKRRELSVLTISKSIIDPSALGFNWAAGVSEDSVLVNQLGQYLKSSGSVLQLNALTDSELHREYMVIGDSADQVIPPYLHNRLRDSLTRYSTAELEYEFAEWDNSSMFDVDSVVLYNNKFYRCVAESLNDEPDNSEKWTLLPNTEIMQTYYESDLNKIRVPAPKSIPDERQHRFNRYGNEIQKRHSWIRDYEQARRVLIEHMNDHLKQANVVDDIRDWQKIVEDFEYSNLWNFIDYTRDGTLWEDRQATVNTVNDLSSVDSNLTYAGVLNSSAVFDDGIRREVYRRESSSNWTLVYKERGTIRLSRVFWDYSQRNYGWDSGLYDSVVWDADPGENLGTLFDRMKDYFYIQTRRYQYVNLWFAVAEYTLSEHVNPYWLLKSDMIRLRMMLEPSSEGYFQKPLDNQVESYVNYEKPFSTKIKDFTLVSNFSDGIDFDTTVLDLSDFVEPEFTLYYDSHDDDGWEELTLTNNDETTNNLDFSNFSSTNYDYVYVGGSFVQPINSGWQDERVELGFHEDVQITVETADPNDLSGPDTRTFRVYTNFYKENKAYGIEDIGVTLAEDIDDSVTKFDVNDGSLLLDPGNVPGADTCTIQVGLELIEYTGISGNTVLGCIRDELATPHSTGEVVRNLTTKAMPLPMYTYQYQINAPLFSEYNFSIIDNTNPAPGAQLLQSYQKGTLD